MTRTSSVSQTFKSVALTTTALGAMLAGATQASAQVATDEIVVTAQKREESSQRVGIAVTAFGEEQMDALGFQNTTDIASQTPGLQHSEFSPTVTIYNIRGVSQNSFSDNLEGPIAVYLDGAYLSNLGTHNLPMFDMKRVEVLKGPQGTLYGRNATGGLIHYISNTPTSSFEASFTGSYASFDNYKIEGAISGPISDRVRVRVAAIDERADGYIKAQVPGVRDAYGVNTTAVKGFVEADLGDNGLLTINPYWMKNSDVPAGAYTRIATTPDPISGNGIPVAPFPNPLVHFSNFSGRYDREFWGVTGTLKLPINDSISLVSVTAYQDLTKGFADDFDGNPVTVADIFGGPFDPAYDNLGTFHSYAIQDFTQFSQELRLEGETPGVKWQAGLYFLDIKQQNAIWGEGLAALWTNDATIAGFGTGTGFSSQARSDSTLRAKNYSAFAQADISLNDKLKLVVGGRLVHDSKEFSSYIRYLEPNGTILLSSSDATLFYGDPTFIAPICYGLTVDSRCAGDTADPSARFKYTDWAGKLQLEYSPRDNLLLYLGVNRGTKGGNWSNPAFSDQIRLQGLATLAHNEETLWSYEGGVKSSLFGGKGRIALSAFYYDYKDYQAFSFVNAVQSVTNNDSEVYGGEIEIGLTPARGLDVFLGASFLHTKTKDLVAPNGTLIRDVEMPLAPSASFNAAIRYAFDFAGGEMAFSVDGNYNSSYFLEVQNSDLAKVDSYFNGNARIAWTSPKGNLEIAGFVRNFTNKTYKAFAGDVPAAGFGALVYSKPRVWGGEVTIRF